MKNISKFFRELISTIEHIFIYSTLYITYEKEKIKNKEIKL